MKKRIVIFALILATFFCFSDLNAKSFGKTKTKATTSRKAKAPRKEKAPKIEKSYSSGSNVIVKEKIVRVPSARKEKGMLSKIGDAATRGYGWQLGKEAAKETIKGAKKLKDKIMNNGENK